MSASQASATTAIAFQLIGALEAYRTEIVQLTASHVDSETYHRLRLRIDEMRRYSAELPSLSTAWVKLLILHFELAHALWKQQQGGMAAESLEAVRDRHRGCMERMRAQCVRVLHQDGAALPPSH